MLLIFRFLGHSGSTAALADANVSACSQLIVGEKWCYVPVVYAKKGVSFAFGMWLSRTQGGGTLPTVGGQGGGALSTVDGVGYGAATIKNVGGVPVTIE